MEKYDVIVVGAGFAGMYMLKRLREQGASVLVLEAGSEVGGTWYWNRYPGLRCDVESMTYSYSWDDDLEQEWTWSERYATHDEILSYAKHVADRFDLRKDIRFGERVNGARYEEGANEWVLTAESGNTYRAHIFVAATGALSVPNRPNFDGLESFEGDWYHTAAWPQEGVDFTGKRVAVVGTGSSGTQIIPIIAESAAHLTVLQRTPNYVIPAWNRPLTREEVTEWKTNVKEIRAYARMSRDGDKWEQPTKSALDVSPEERDREYERRYHYGSFGFMSSFTDLLRDEEANSTAADFMRRKIAERLDDPRHVAIMTPTAHIGTKRMCVDTGFYEAFNRDNVDLVDLRATPMEKINSAGIATSDQQIDVDIIVFATGYDAITGALKRMNITGRDGISLNESWKNGPHTYLGLAVPGFPNLLTVTGPHSPTVFTNVMNAIEQHVEWISDCIAYLRDNKIAVFEATSAAELAWMEHAAEEAAKTLYPLANSWYVGANIEGKPRGLMPYAGGFARYGEIIDEVAASNYRGFALTPSTAPSMIAN